MKLSRAETTWVIQFRRYLGMAHGEETQNICITSVQRRPHVFDVGPTLYKCHAIFLCLLSGEETKCVLYPSPPGSQFKS